MDIGKKPLGIDVFTAARQRVEWVFDTFERVSVSFSGGKDSSVMTHIVAEEARKRKRKFALLYIDLEGQYQYTIEHIRHVINEYKDLIDLHWVCLPIHLRNAVSVYEPFWKCWDPKQEDKWIRPLPPEAIKDQKFYPFFKEGMEFEEFVPEWNKWFGKGKTCASLVGIRSDESLNRYRTIKRRKTTFDGRQYTTWCGDGVFNVYPIYDWQTRDIWIYNGKTGKSYNKLYDLMHRAGLSIHQQRICQPYGDDQRKGLWLFHLIEPETWSRIVARVNGANSGALYARESGNINGNIRIKCPEGKTWEEFAKLLLESMPEKTMEHYKNKIAIFLRWWKIKEGYDTIPDYGDINDEASRAVPSWRRVCKALLRNDYWCKGLSFSQTKPESYQKYLKLMKRRRLEWELI
jgi:predicted phosphoadenosine phosphosulfate sulfurtransferase